MIIVAVSLFVLAAACLALSVCHFRQRGYLFNNAYIYASKTEREAMDKAPHYRQSAIVLLLVAALFALLGFSVLTQKQWLLWAAGAVTAGSLIYAVVSSIKIEKNKRS